MKTKVVSSMLKVEKLNVHYGVIHAINDVSLEVNDGEIVTLIGANGAGKTTILQTITGLKKATSGLVTFDDIDLLKEEPSKIINHGIAHVPEGRHVFVDMTVRENIEMGAYMFSRKDKAQIEEQMENVFEKFPRLKERQSQLAGTLSGGEQQMLAVGRALMSKPRIILMDEPSMGLSPLLVQEIFAIIKEVNRQGITILLVEQNAKMALKVANRAYVLETGKIKLSGDAKELLKNDEVKKAYLGA
jgi:branched-chain amino acid transport system ATP-binding protein